MRIVVEEEEEEEKEEEEEEEEEILILPVHKIQNKSTALGYTNKYKHIP